MLRIKDQPSKRPDIIIIDSFVFGEVALGDGKLLIIEIV